MNISRRKAHQGMITGIVCAVLVLLTSGNNIKASESTQESITVQPLTNSGSTSVDTKDSNESAWKKWDAVIKNPNDPNEILKAKWNAIVTVMQNKDLAPDLQRQIINKIISPIFDTDLMAKLVLGRTNWPKLNASQQKHFTELFAERIKSFYLEKTSLFNNQKVSFKPATQNRTSVYIPMVITSDGKDVSIQYKFHKLNEADMAGSKIYWKIYDVEIEGVSVLMTYQSQFDDILRKGSVKDLFDQLEKPPTN